MTPEPVENSRKIKWPLQLYLIAALVLPFIFFGVRFMWLSLPEDIYDRYCVVLTGIALCWGIWSIIMFNKKAFSSKPPRAGLYGKVDEPRADRKPLAGNADKNTLLLNTTWLVISCLFLFLEAGNYLAVDYRSFIIDTWFLMEYIFLTSYVLLDKKWPYRLRIVNNMISFAVIALIILTMTGVPVFKATPAAILVSSGGADFYLLNFKIILFP